MGKGGSRELWFHEFSISVLQDEKILVNNNGSVLYLLLNYILKSGWDGKFYVINILSQLLKMFL